MPDLEQRLRDDVVWTNSTDDPVPDFAEALDAALSRPAGRSRSQIVAGAGAAAAVLVLASGVALLRHHGAPDRPAHRTHAAGRGAPKTLPVVGAIVEPGSDAPRQLMVIVRNDAKGCLASRPTFG